MRIIYVSESTSLCQRSSVHALTHIHILESCYLARIVHEADKLWPQTPLICPIICASSLQQSRVGECTTVRWSHRKQFRSITSSIRRNVDGRPRGTRNIEISNYSCARGCALHDDEAIWRAVLDVSLFYLPEIIPSW